MKTPAQYQREYRARKKKAEIALAAPSEQVFRTPFFEYFNRATGGFYYNNWRQYLDFAGIEAPAFEDDSGPRSLSGTPEYDFQEGSIEDDPFKDYQRSIGRAEVIVEHLLYAANELAEIINDYKQSEIKARIAEIEQSDLSAPETKRKALADIVRLQKMLDQLSKQVRWTFPQWKVTGE
jgi:hypothetical protein